MVAAYTQASFTEGAYAEAARLGLKIAERRRGKLRPQRGDLVVSFFTYFSWLGMKPRPCYVWEECSNLAKLRCGTGALASTSFVGKVMSEASFRTCLLCDVFMASTIKACVGLYGGVSHLSERAKGDLI